MRGNPWMLPSDPARLDGYEVMVLQKPGDETKALSTPYVMVVDGPTAAVLFAQLPPSVSSV